MVKVAYTCTDGGTKRLMCIDENSYDMDFLLAPSSAHKRMRHDDPSTEEYLFSSNTPTHDDNRKSRSDMTPKASPITQPPLVFSIGRHSNSNHQHQNNLNKLAHDALRTSGRTQPKQRDIPSSILISSDQVRNVHSYKQKDSEVEVVVKDPTQIRLIMSPTPLSNSLVPATVLSDGHHREVYSPTKLVTYLHDQKWAKVKQRCINHPEEASIWFTKVSSSKKEVHSRDLPIHIAIANITSQPMPKDVFEALVMAYPEGLVSKTDDGKCPLHIVCEIEDADTRNNMIQMLIKANPHVSKLKTRAGNLPLHIACRHRNLLLETAQMLINAYPEAVLVTGEMDRLALQTSSASGIKLSVIKFLLSNNPDGIYWKDSFDALPLHLACKNNAREEVCLHLLSEYHHASHIGDCWDKLPIHYVCECSMSEALVKTLLLKFPESIYIKDNTGKTPIDLAQESSSNTKEKIMQILKDHKENMNKSSTITHKKPYTAARTSEVTNDLLTFDADKRFNDHIQREIHDVRSELSDVKGMLNQIIIFMGKKDVSGESKIS